MDGAERVNRSLDDYEERTLLTSTAANHQVYKVTFGLEIVRGNGSCVGQIRRQMASGETVQLAKRQSEEVVSHRSQTITIIASERTSFSIFRWSAHSAVFSTLA